jgi:hypothetical protein
MPTEDVVIHESKDLKVTLQTWRGDGSRLFQFESGELLLRVNFINGEFVVITNQGKVQIESTASCPASFRLSK